MTNDEKAKAGIPIKGMTSGEKAVWAAVFAGQYLPGPFAPRLDVAVLEKHRRDSMCAAINEADATVEHLRNAVEQVPDGYKGFLGQMVLLP